MWFLGRWHECHIDNTSNFIFFNCEASHTVEMKHAKLNSYTDGLHIAGDQQEAQLWLLGKDDYMVIPLTAPLHSMLIIFEVMKWKKVNNQPLNDEHTTWHFLRRRCLVDDEVGGEEMVTNKEEKGVYNHLCGNWVWAYLSEWWWEWEGQDNMLVHWLMTHWMHCIKGTTRLWCYVATTMRTITERSQ